MVGAWGMGNFENDDAMDFLNSANTFADLSAAFNAVPQAANIYLEAPQSSEALAAAELVAAISGKAATELPEDAARVAERLASTCDGVLPNEMIESALAAVSRVLTDSELLELWDEGQDGDKWRALVSELIDRLS